jgi:hypothetical protein
LDSVLLNWEIVLLAGTLLNIIDISFNLSGTVGLSRCLESLIWLDKASMISSKLSSRSLSIQFLQGSFCSFVLLLVFLIQNDEIQIQMENLKEDPGILENKETEAEDKGDFQQMEHAEKLVVEVAHEGTSEDDVPVPAIAVSTDSNDNGDVPDMGGSESSESVEGESGDDKGEDGDDTEGEANEEEDSEDGEDSLSNDDG